MKNTNLFEVSRTVYFSLLDLMHFVTKSVDVSLTSISGFDALIIAWPRSVPKQIYNGTRQHLTN